MDYHSHVRNGMRHCWEVRRLWKYAESIPAKRVSVKALRANLDGSCWFTTNPVLHDIVEHMRRVMRADLRYPIILSPDNLVMDGLHRLTKAILRKNKYIWAVKLPRLPVPDEILPIKETS